MPHRLPDKRLLFGHCPNCAKYNRTQAFTSFVVNGLYCAKCNTNTIRTFWKDWYERMDYLEPVHIIEGWIDSIVNFIKKPSFTDDTTDENSQGGQDYETRSIE